MFTGDQSPPLSVSACLCMSIYVYIYVCLYMSVYLCGEQQEQAPNLAVGMLLVAGDGLKITGLNPVALVVELLQLVLAGTQVAKHVKGHVEDACQHAVGYDPLSGHRLKTEGGALTAMLKTWEWWTTYLHYHQGRYRLADSLACGGSQTVSSCHGGQIPTPVILVCVTHSVYG